MLHVYLSPPFSPKSAKRRRHPKAFKEGTSPPLLIQPHMHGAQPLALASFWGLSASLRPYPGLSDVLRYPLFSHQGFTPHCVLRQPDSVSLGIATGINSYRSCPVSRSWGVAQLVKCLPYKCEDQDLILRTHVEKGDRGKVAYTCNPSTHKGLTAQPAWSAS